MIGRARARVDEDLVLFLGDLANSASATDESRDIEDDVDGHPDTYHCRGDAGADVRLVLVVEPRQCRP